MAEAWRDLRVGDRIRPVGDPPEWQQPGYHLPTGTRDLWRLLVGRRRAMRVYNVDEWGAPWVQCRVRLPGGGWRQHFLAITQGGWVRVRGVPRSGR